MLEKDFQTEFGHWVKRNFVCSAVFELKSCRAVTLPFMAVKPHQVQGLLHAKHSKIYMKLPDVGFQMPWDCFIVVNVPAFVVVRYPSGIFYLIDIDDFVRESTSSIKRSLTETRAAEICTSKGS